MKIKSSIIILSVLLNLVLFSTLAYFDKFNSSVESTVAPFIVIQHLGAQSAGHEIASVATVK
jgi:hypothetical protein